MTARVWLIDTAALDLVPDTLDEHELARAATFALPAHRHRFTVAHTAARAITGHVLGIEPERVRWRGDRTASPNPWATPGCG